MKIEFEHIGFTIIESVYSLEELDEILKFLDDNEISGQFGVREFLYKNPEIKSKKMLNELEIIFKTNKIYCIPFTHLEKFYGSIGFRKVETELSPQFFQTRLIKYINAGYDCIMMMKQSI